MLPYGFWWNFILDNNDCGPRYFDNSHWCTMSLTKLKFIRLNTRKPRTMCPIDNWPKIESIVKLHYRKFPLVIFKIRSNLNVSSNYDLNAFSRWPSPKCSFVFSILLCSPEDNVAHYICCQISIAKHFEVFI